MKDDPCKVLREAYDGCFQIWLDAEYFAGKIKGPMVPCEAELKTYHECLKTDPHRAPYLENLEKYKKDFPR
ncbi:hypothetical protein SteCoe_2409 [Stentor coeruleus]|uniref:CHCH domain-containing protein n=1 Tax=Stentor coeruleus TaxID=5963 RepID=A0A1R2CZC8_9CILI|nr:hypothetical protein SteCoe_2409 [Stentor coeruleus]